MDSKRFVCMRISGTPCYVWGDKFFRALADIRESFIKCDEIILARYSIEEARMYIESGWMKLINETVNVVIDNVPVYISLRDDPSMLKDMTPARRNWQEEGAESDDSLVGVYLEEANSCVERASLEELEVQGKKETLCSDCTDDSLTLTRFKKIFLSKGKNVDFDFHCEGNVSGTKATDKKAFNASTNILDNVEGSEIRESGERI